MVLNRIPGKGHSKLITAGLGWATAEVILTRGLVLWVGARGAEFSWLYIQKCLESNISLVRKKTQTHFLPILRSPQLLTRFCFLLHSRFNI